MRRDDNDYQAWLWGEVLLFGLLGAALALFLANPTLRSTYELPQARLVIDTAAMLAAAVVAVLAGLRFSVEARRFDLLLCAGFTMASATALGFAIGPILGGEPLHRAEAWTAVGGRLAAATLIAAAPFARGRLKSQQRALWNAVVGVAVALMLIWGFSHSLESALPALASGAGDDQPGLLTAALAAQALLSLVALVGFGLRFRRGGHDLDRWLALATTLFLFAELHYVFTPLVSTQFVSQGDFLRLLAYGVLLVGVWRAIRSSEFGRAVAEERARVAREIHDGLAQYLFAVSTHATMLERGAPLEPTVASLKEAATAAQQEARFAILALSSASGTASFDSALRRYVDFVTADGALEVELEIDPGVHLAPDEQIEVFRIVQEGIANARKHAGATCAEVEIAMRGDERVVTIRDDGAGFESDEAPAGQGLKNMQERSASIGGGFRLDSKPGFGTALEVTLRA